MVFSYSYRILDATTWPSNDSSPTEYRSVILFWMESEKCPFWNPPSTIQELSEICAAIFSYELNWPSVEKPIILDGLISDISSKNVWSLSSSNNSLFDIIFFSWYNFKILS